MTEAVSWVVALSVGVASVTAFCLGYDAGVMSAAIGPMREEFRLSPWEEGIVMGCINVMAAVSAPIGSRVGDKFGRVPALALTAAFLALGPVVIASAQSKAVLIFGRLLAGVGVGFAFVIAALYAAELSPPRFRGMVVTTVEVLVNLGTVMGYASALLTGHGSTVLNWRFATGIAWLPAAVVLCCIPWLPESPRWLAKEGLWEQAAHTLTRLHGKANIDGQLRSLQASLKEEEHEAAWSDVLCPTPRVRRMLLCGVGCAFFQQASGSEAIVYYSPSLIGGFGVQQAEHQNQQTIFIGLAKFAGALMGGPFLDFFGRRPSVLVSTTGCAVCLGLLALLVDSDAPSRALGLALLMMFMVSFELGLAPAAFVLGTESYPTAIRAKALSLGMLTTRFLSGLVAILFPILMDAWTLGSVLKLFAFVGAIGVVWAATCVPETKGLSLEEVTKLFDSPSDAGVAPNRVSEYGAVS